METMCWFFPQLLSAKPQTSTGAPPLTPLGDFGPPDLLSPTRAV